jgi:hypothetical protein
MSINVSIFLGFILSAISWVGTVFRIFIRKQVDLVDWFVCSLGFVYGVSYILVLFSTYQGYNPYWEHYILSFEHIFWLVPVFGLIALFGTWLGGCLCFYIDVIHVSSSSALKKQTNSIEKLAWFFLILSVAGYWLYARTYGGFIGLLDYSSLIRSGFVDIKNPWSFLNRFGGFAFFASFLFMALFIRYKYLFKRTILGLAFISSLVFSVYVLYSWKGRVGFLTYLAVFPLGYIFLHNGYGFKALTKIIIIVLLVILVLPVFSTWLTPGKASENICMFYAKELSYPYVSLYKSIEANSYRYGRDAVLAPIYFLPQRVWWGIFSWESASDQNTINIMGFRKGEAGVTGGIPTDFITFWYMQLGVYSVAIGGIIWGILLRLFDKFIRSIAFKELCAFIYAYAVLSVSVLTSLYADPYHIIRRNFHFFIGLIVVSIFVRTLFNRPFNKIQKANVK